MGKKEGSEGNTEDGVEGEPYSKEDIEERKERKENQEKKHGHWGEDQGNG